MFCCAPHVPTRQLLWGCPVRETLPASAQHATPFVTFVAHTLANYYACVHATAGIYILECMQAQCLSEQSPPSCHRPASWPWPSWSPPPLAWLLLPWLPPLWLGLWPLLPPWPSPWHPFCTKSTVKALEVHAKCRLSQSDARHACTDFQPCAPSWPSSLDPPPPSHWSLPAALLKQCRWRMVV